MNWGLLELYYRRGRFLGTGRGCREEGSEKVLHQGNTLGLDRGFMAGVCRRQVGEVALGFFEHGPRQSNSNSVGKVQP